MVFLKDEAHKKIPISKMEFLQKEYFYWDNKSYMLQTNCYRYNTEKIMKKPNYLCKGSTENTNEYSTIFTTKTYSNVTGSILSYIVGGFVGSKSQMNNNKNHILSYDLSAAISNLLNPWRYESEKEAIKRNQENICGVSSKLQPECYDKYIYNKSFKETEKEKDCIVNVVDIECLISMPLKESVLNGNNKCSESDLRERNNFMLNLGDSKICDMNQDSSSSNYLQDPCPNSTLCKFQVPYDAKNKLLMESKGFGNLKSTFNIPTYDVLRNQNIEYSECGKQNTIANDYCTSSAGELHHKHSCDSLVIARYRQQSECSVESTDSESFIVFEEHNDEENELGSHNAITLELNSNNMDSDDSEDDCDYTNSDEDDCYENNSSSDEYDFCTINKNLLLANDKWLRNYHDVNVNEVEVPRKVRFNNNIKVNKIVAWDHAYRTARVGPWEQLARDRFRFHERISRLSAIISPILKQEHRNKIYRQMKS